MSPDVWDFIENEFKLLNRLLEKHAELIRSSRDKVPEEFYVSALGAMLQSFYGGVENLFKRIALGLDGDFSKSESWHKNLLDRMAGSFKDRPAVISENVRVRLHKHLDFRHVFRSAYSYDLSWPKMRDLVLTCEETLRLLEVEVEVFTAAFKKKFPE